MQMKFHSVPVPDGDLLFVVLIAFVEALTLILSSITLLNDLGIDMCQESRRSFNRTWMKHVLNAMFVLLFLTGIMFFSRFT